VRVPIDFQKLGLPAMSPRSSSFPSLVGCVLIARVAPRLFLVFLRKRPAWSVTVAAVNHVMPKAFISFT